MRKSRKIDNKIIQIKGEKLPKAVKFEIIISKIGATWYNIKQKELNYNKDFMYYPLSDVIKLVRNDLYEKLTKIKENL